MEIKNVEGREILDSRGMPTVYARVTLEGGAFGEAAAPSGASTGKFEAVELRDGDQNRLNGKGVQKAVSNVNTILAGKLIGRQFTAQEQLDEFLCRIDNTENKSWLGANAILAVSMAASKAFACEYRMPLYEYLRQGDSGKFVLPTPMMNILNGGAHASNNVDIQEFMIMPVGASSFREAVFMGAEVYMSLKACLKAAGLNIAVGDEGGFAPDLKADEEAIEWILKAIDQAGLNGVVWLALDAAASEWATGEGEYRLPKKGKAMSREALARYFADLARDYGIISIEDPLGEEDYEGFQRLAAMTKIQIVGDDLFVTNPKRIEEGMGLGIANGILIKPNQIGTVSEAVEAVRLGQSGGYSTILSHRSGETEDTYIADMAVGLGCGQIKTGAPARGERTAKYNRLMEIEHELGTQAVYLGGQTVKGFQ